MMMTNENNSNTLLKKFSRRYSHERPCLKSLSAPFHWAACSGGRPSSAGVWEVTPLYLKAKLEWSLADWISYLTCRSCLGVAALVLVLPLLRRLWSLQDTTLGVLGGVSSLLSSVCLSFLTSSSPAVIPLGISFISFP